MIIEPPYVIINIPNKTKKDKRLLYYICRLTGKKWVTGQIVDLYYNWDKIKYNPVQITIELNNKNNCISYGQNESYIKYLEDIRIKDYQVIDYKDFLKEKGTTIDILKNYIKE